MLNQSGSVLDLLHVWEKNHAFQLHAEAISHMADCVYTESICYRSFDASMLMTNTPNITQLEYNCMLTAHYAQGIALHTRLIYHCSSKSEESLFLSKSTAQ